MLLRNDWIDLVEENWVTAEERQRIYDWVVKSKFYNDDDLVENEDEKITLIVKLILLLEKDGIG